MRLEYSMKQGQVALQVWIEDRLEQPIVSVLAITGGSASGKSYLSKTLSQIEGVSFLEMDKYLFERKKQTELMANQINHDHPTVYNISLFAEHVKTLRENKSIQAPRFYGRKQGTILMEPSSVIIIEGLFTFYQSDIGDLSDCKVYVHADDDVRLERRVVRDVMERGQTEQSVRKKWTNTVLPMHKLYVEPQRTLADILIVNN